MSRNLKALGLAMFAVFALSALAASSAQAVIHHVTVPGFSKAYVTAKEEETNTSKFTITVGAGSHSVKCDATFEGTLPEETNKKVTVTPTFTECKVDGTISATVDVNHCAFVFEGDTVLNHAGVEIECAKKEGTEETTEITITYSVFGSSCVVHIHPNETYRGIHYTQTLNPTTKKQDITVQATVTGIKYKETGGGFCPATTTREDGEFTGTFTAEAFEHKGTELVGTELTTPTITEGNVIDLELTESNT